MNYLLDTLAELCNTPSPTGYTEAAMAAVERKLQELGISYSRARKGSLIATIPGKKEGYLKVIAAHTDTLGAMVKQVKSDGTLALTSLGGYMATSIECENAVVHSNDAKFQGTIYTVKPSVHVHGTEAKALERNMDNLVLVLDEKVKSAEDVKALGIGVGDFVSFESRFRITEKGFVKSRHLDDKGGVAVILAALKKLVEEERSGEVTREEGFLILITGHEEMGYGASSNVPPEAIEMLCVDMGTPGPDQETDEYTVSICAKDGAMPYDLGVRNKLIQLSKENGIEYRVDTYNFYGSDGKASLVAGHDLRVGLIGPGIFASHSYERTHRDSLMHSANLVYQYMKSKV